MAQVDGFPLRRLLPRLFGIAALFAVGLVFLLLGILDLLRYLEGVLLVWGYLGTPLRIAALLLMGSLFVLGSLVGVVALGCRRA